MTIEIVRRGVLTMEFDFDIFTMDRWWVFGRDNVISVLKLKFLKEMKNVNYLEKYNKNFLERWN